MLKMVKAYHHKIYADACVQTLPTGPATQTNTEDTKPTNMRLKRVMYAGEELVGTTCTPPERLIRVYPKSPAKPHLAYNGSPLSVEAYAQRRIVSLPEAATTASELTRSILFNPRSVSMPSAMQHFAATLGSGDDSGLSSSFSADETDQSRHHLSAYWTRTPSLPPTPGSVEIIDNSFCLPEIFLKTENGAQASQKYTAEDWIAWTNSPPRPIPALHGPASLPYARCPSGAEGTVIEEPATVPGLIWGLEADHRVTSERVPVLTRGNFDRGSDVSKIGDSGGQRECRLGHLKEPGSIDSLSRFTEYMDNDLIRNHSLDQVNTSTFDDQHIQELRKIHDNLFLDASAPIFVPNGRKIDNVRPLDARSAAATDLMHNTEQHGTRPLPDHNARALHKYGYSIKNALLTPPDSSSPLWTSSSPTVYSESQAVALGIERPRLPSTNLGLNLLTPAARIDELTEQIHRLSLQQQKNHEAIVRLGANAEQSNAFSACATGNIGPHTPATDAVSTASTPLLSKPAMPISLPDLVAQHTPGHTPEMIGSILLPPVLLANPPQSIDRPGVRMPYPTATSSVQQILQHQDHHDFNTGKDLVTRRHPRSVPFSRLLERKLASVPEETSITDEGSSTQNSALRRARITSFDDDVHNALIDNKQENICIKTFKVKESPALPVHAASKPKKKQQKAKPIREATNAPEKNCIEHENGPVVGTKPSKKSSQSSKGKSSTKAVNEPIQVLKKGSSTAKTRRK